MSLFTTGASLIKSGKILLEKSAKVSSIVNAGLGIIDRITDSIGNKQKTPTEADIAELKEQILEIVKVYDEKIDSLEKLNEELITDNENLRKELQACKEENEAIRKKAKRNLLLVSIIGGVALVTAIILAIVL